MRRVILIDELLKGIIEAEKNGQQPTRIILGIEAQKRLHKEVLDISELPEDSGPLIVFRGLPILVKPSAQMDSWWVEVLDD